MSSPAEPFPAAQIFRLASGEQLTAAIRRSARARRASLRLTPDGRLSLTLPAHWPASAARDCHDRFLSWLERAWARHLASHLRQGPARGLPEQICLPLPGRAFRVELHPALEQGRRRSLQAVQAMLCASGTKRLLLLEEKNTLGLYGPQDDVLAAEALRRWCRAQAAALLPGHVQGLARTGGFAPVTVHIRDQRSRWGSCSRRPDSGTGHIQLNWRAVLLPVPLLEHLIWHELCHLRHMNHSPAYRAELARYSPQWPEQEKALNCFWRELPGWATP